MKKSGLLVLLLAVFLVLPLAVAEDVKSSNFFETKIDVMEEASPVVMTEIAVEKPVLSGDIIHPCVFEDNANLERKEFIQRLSRKEESGYKRFYDHPSFLGVT